MYRINDRFEYKSLSAIFKVLQRIKEENVGQTLSGDDYDHALWALERRNPEVMGTRPEIKVSERETLPGKCFFMKTETGWRAFSARKACMDNPQSVHRHCVNQALRAEIANQVRSFRQDAMSQPENDHYLAIAINNKEAIEVDHVLHFWKLRDSWLEEEDLAIDEIKVDQDPEGRQFLKNRNLAERWWRYHKKHAVLRLLTKEENQKRGGAE